MSERGAPMSAVAFRRTLTRLRPAAKMPFPIHPHMLRHSTGFKLANQGVSELCRAYRVRVIEGDRFGGGFHSNSWARNAISYRACDRTTSENYLRALPLLLSGRARLPDAPVLRSQLAALERRVHVNGRESVSHTAARSAHDDTAAAVCGALVAAAGKHDPHEGMPHWWRHMQTTPEGDAVARAERDRRLGRQASEAERNVANGSRPCTVDWAALESARELPEGVTRKQVGPPRIW